MPCPPLPDVSSRYGAPMGRPDRPTWFDLQSPDGAEYALDSDFAHKFYLVRVPLDGGGYDAGGAYWGHGAPLYRAVSENETVTRYIRATGGRYGAAARETVKATIRAEFPNARFFR